MSTKTWTSQADWQGYSSQSLIPPIDTTTVVNSIVAQKYMWNTNIEDETTGGFPSVNWKVAVGDTANRVVATDQSVSPTRSIKFTIPDTTDREITNIVAFKDTATFSIQFSVRAAQTDHEFDCYIQDSSGHNISIFYLRQTADFRYWDGSVKVLPVAASYTLNTWYTVLITVNKTTNKARWYINGAYKGEGALGTTSFFPERVCFGTGGAAGASAFWIDDILVWDVYDGVVANYQSATTANYQLDSGAPAVGTENRWTSFSFNGSKPSNTNLRFRFKTASTQAGLATAVYSSYYTANGNLTDVANNRWIEVQAELSTTDGISTPQLDDLTINYQTISGTRIAGLRNIGTRFI